MKKKIFGISILIILWLAAVIACSLIFVELRQKSDGYTADNACTEFADHIYITDNAHGNGFLYMMNTTGEVEALFSVKDSLIEGFRVTDVDVLGEDLYIICERRHDDNGRVVNQYVTARLNESMQITGLTPIFRFPMELDLQGLDVAGDRIYVTALSENGQQAYVYTLDLSSLIGITGGSSTAADRTNWLNSAAEVKEYAMQESVRPRYMVQAIYENESLQVRYDDSAPGYFAVDENVRRLFETKKLSLSRKMEVAGFDAALVVIVALSGTMILILITILMRERLRIVYAAFAFEILLILVLGVFFAVFSVLSGSVAKREYIRYEEAAIRNIFDGYGNADLTASDFYNTPDYEILSARIRRRIPTGADDTDPTVDLLVADGYSGRVILSAGGKNIGSITSLYGAETADFIVPGFGNDESPFMKINHQGEAYTLFRTSLLKSGYPDLVAVSVIRDKGLFRETYEHFGEYLNLLFFLFLLCSIVGISLLIWQSLDIRKLKKALAGLAKGEELTTKPVMHGRDMNYLWNSVFEIQKNIASTNRVKFLTYEAYYRFAPKSIERILQKGSITEVGVGDRAHLHGTLTYVTLPGLLPEQDGSLSRFSDLLQTVEELIREYDGILISQDADSAILRVLFLEDNKDAAGFGTDLILRLKEEKQGVFKNAAVTQQYTTFLYGVAGTAEGASVYISSKEGEFLASFAKWFASMALGQVITREMMTRMDHVGETRYIGFLLPNPSDPENRLELYEVLDAQIPGTRKRRSATKKKFDEALSLFYQQDFYLARNLFTEILRESPDDLLTKWYLFECEHYLDEGFPEGFTGALHKEG